MKKTICKKCDNIMEKKFKDGEKMYFCKYCNGYTNYEVKEVKNFCDKCEEELEVVKGCGSINFFCNNCNEIRSKKVIKTKYSDV